MARYAKFFSVGAGGGTNNLQLPLGTILDTTLRQVQDGTGTGSPLYLSTDLVQINSTLRITTADNPYIDAEDGAGNNRFTIGRDPLSQQVNVDFASNPLGSTTTVGAIRTYQDGTNLSEVMQFREDGSIFGSGTQAASNFVIQKDITNDLIIYSSATWGGLLTIPTSGGGNTMLNGRVTGSHGGFGNVAVGLGTVQADGSAYNFNVAMGQGSFARGINCLALGQGASAGSSTTAPTAASAIGTGAIATTSNAMALGNASTLLQIGGNFTPTARVHVRGSGSTSATTSLLVQNSTPVTTFSVNDAGDTTTLGNATFGGGFVQVQGAGGSGIFASTYSSVVLRGASAWALGNNTGSIGSTNGFINYSSSYTLNVEQTNILRCSNMQSGGGEGRFVLQAQGNATGYNAVGNMYIAGGRNTNGGAHGNVYLGVDLTGALGNVGIGTTTPTARLQVKGSGTTSGTTAFLITNGAATPATTFSVNDAGELSLPSTAPKITLGGDLTITSTVSPTRLMIYDVNNSNLSVNVGGVGEGCFIGNRFTLSRASTTYVTPDALNATGGAFITAYDSNGNIAINASNNGNRSIALRGLGASGAVLIGNITTANGTPYSAILQADSTTQGFLPPRMTTAQKNAISSPANGLIVYDTDLVRPCFFNGATWITL